MWSGENEGYHIAFCPFAMQQAVCQAVSPGKGTPMFAKPHMNRQREAMAKALCDLCGRPLKGRTRVSLSQEREAYISGIGTYAMAVEPMVHKDCAAVCIKACPVLRRQHKDGTLLVRQITSYRLICQQLTGEATAEFTGVHRPYTVGHIKLLITGSHERSPEWLQTK